MWEYWHHAEDSLKHLGTVAHNGEIPIENITRVVKFNPIPLTFVFDPTITMLNHSIMSEYYESGTAWIMDGSEITGHYNNGTPEMWAKLRKEIGAETIYEKTEEAA